MKLFIATRNPGKAREFRQLFAPLGAELFFPSDLGLDIEVVEDGETYAENACKKALAYVRSTGMLTCADDSGLEVDALGGAPGVRSARYTTGRDEDRATALLNRLRDTPPAQRTARFRCVIAIAAPDGALHTVEGVCEGVIAQQPAGTGGFGYDPVFYLPEHGCTMAQLSAAEKNRISHRARAVEAAIALIRRPGGFEISREGVAES